MPRYKFLTRRKTPVWLQSMTSEMMRGIAFPLAKILKNSLYYPASHFDGRVVKELGYGIKSFIYVDNNPDNASGEKLDCELRDIKAAFPDDEVAHIPRFGFYAYSILGRRSVTQTELSLTGWKPEVLPDHCSPDVFCESIKWIEWIVFQRDSYIGPSGFPSRFSLLYLHADGSAAYQALYNRNNITPEILAIINPGFSFGGNYEDWFNPDSILPRSVNANQSGVPRIVLMGDDNGHVSRTRCEWPETHGYDLGWMIDQQTRVWGSNAYYLDDGGCRDSY